MASRPGILVCVTPQRSCRYLIACGQRLAEEQGADLRIVSILPLRQSVAPDLAALEALNEFAREFGAEMTVSFSDDPARSVSDMVRELHVSALLTGFPGKNSTQFVEALHKRIPHIPLWMADNDGTAYTIGRAVHSDMQIVADSTFFIPLPDSI